MDEHFGRRSSDGILIRLEVQTENLSKALEKFEILLVKHEDRIQSCEKQHSRIKAIILTLGVVWAGLTWYLDWRK